MHSHDASAAPSDAPAPLAHWGLIRARGADAAKFLQGQLTNDVATLGASEVRLAGFCSAKGRLQASFIAWKTAPEEFLLACHASVLPATLKRLSMFVMRAQCRLSDAGAELSCNGLIGAAATRALADAGLADVPAWRHGPVQGGSLLQLPSVDGVERAVLIAAPAEVTSTDTAARIVQWRWLEVHSGVPVIEAATVDQFVPQMLNYELIGGVDFQKGCYPGQEVVARSQYRGTIKRRMFLFDADVAAAPGQEIFHSADPSQPAGMVVNAAPRPGGTGTTGGSLLAEVKLAALAKGTLHLGTGDGPLITRLALPYPVPMPEEAADAPCA